MPRPFAWTKYYQSGQKIFPMLKKYIFACKTDGKWVFSHGQYFFMAKRSFSIHFIGKYVHFSLGKNFVQADGRGISIYRWHLIHGSTVSFTRKYPLHGHILSVLTNAHNCLGPIMGKWWKTEVSSNIFSLALPCLMIYYTWHGFALPHGSQESVGDPKCIFFTPYTNQGTFINDILWYDLKS